MESNKAILKDKNNLLKPNSSNYTCIFHYSLTINDCINSIDLLDDKIIFGTIMGDVCLCRVAEDKKFTKHKQLSKLDEIQKSILSLNKTQLIDNDESQIEINKKSNKYECMKYYKSKNLITEHGNKTKFHKKRQKKGSKLKINEYNYKDNLNLEKDSIDNDDSSKYEKQLILQNMRKGFSENCTRKNKLNPKFFNDKKDKKAYIPFPKITKLIVQSKENIPCLQFHDDDTINISIGDLEIIHLENMSKFNINDNTSTYNYSKIRNYTSENEHIENCENCTCMMSNSHYLILFTRFGNFNSEIETTLVKYENKNLINFNIIKGSMKLSNYVVPFDFDGDRFLFVDYISKNERKISIVYTITEQNEFKFLIKDKNYGHISHMKFLLSNKIFICKNTNECEIHIINENFDTTQKWTHFGYDMISSYIFIKHKFNNENGFNNNNTTNEYKDNIGLIDGNTNKNEIISINKSYFNSKKLNKYNINKNLEQIPNLKNEINLKVDNKLSNGNNLINKHYILNKKSNIQTDLVSAIINNNIHYYNYTENSNIIHNNKNMIFNKIKTPNQSLNNSSRRDIILTVGNSVKNHNFIRNQNKYNKKNIRYSSSIDDILNKNNNSDNRGAMQNDETNTCINENYSIATLDVKGNFNIFSNNRQFCLFNLYEIINIDEKYKNMQFFSAGFPYYIIYNDSYYCITTDHGLFVITKQIDDN